MVKLHEIMPHIHKQFEQSNGVETVVHDYKKTNAFRKMICHNTLIMNELIS